MVLFSLPQKREHFSAALSHFETSQENTENPLDMWFQRLRNHSSIVLSNLVARDMRWKFPPKFAERITAEFKAYLFDHVGYSLSFFDSSYSLTLFYKYVKYKTRPHFVGGEFTKVFALLVQHTQAPCREEEMAREDTAYFQGRFSTLSPYLP